MITDRLTQEQQSAVNRTDGKVCLRAGAGTGKTSVLVSRYLNILRQGLGESVPVQEVLSGILAVTFTRRSANEMKERIRRELSALFPEQEDMGSLIQVSTIDSFCGRILREKSVLIGIDPDFTVLEEIEAKLFFMRTSRQVLDRETLPEIEMEKSMDGFLSDVFEFIQKLKSMGISPEELHKSSVSSPDSSQVARQFQSVESLSLLKIIHRLYFVYEEELNRENFFDFHRLLIEVRSLWQRHAGVKKEYQDRFRYILIDEYQDTSPLQDMLLRTLSGQRENYFVVGDYKQSIYGFRGAEPGNIVSYEKEAGKNLFSLTRNFRSYEEILSVVNLSLGDKIRGYEEIHSEKRKGEGACELYLAPDQDNEAHFIAGRIAGLVKEGFPPGGIVVLMRGVKSKAMEYEEVLRAHGISAVTIGGSGFYDRPEIRDVFAMLRLIENPFDDQALVRFLCSPLFQVRNSTLAGLASLEPAEEADDEEIIPKKRVPLYDALGRVSGLNVDKDQKDSVMKLKEFLDRIIFRKNDYTLSGLLEEAVNSSGYLLYLETLEEALSRRSILNVQKLLELSREFEAKNVFSRLGDFVRYLDEVIKGEIVEREASLDDWENVVRIMTIHQAKGLEFPVVFVSNISRQNFPSPNRQPAYHFHREHGFIRREEGRESGYHKLLKKDLELKHTEEEQRLLYVAMTRARERLIITGSRRNGTVSEFMEYFLKEDAGWDLLRDEFRGLITFHGEITTGGEKEEVPACVTREEEAFDRDKVLERIAFRYPEVPGEVPLELTVSQLATFRECPARYYYRYVLDLPQNPGQGKESLSDDGFQRRLFGDIVHRALEEYFKEKRKGNRWTPERLEKKYRELCLNFGISQAALQSAYLPYGKTVLKNIYDSDYNRSGRDILAVEQPFVLFLGKDIIKGTIDRIDRTKEGIELIDYKTSSSISTQRYAFQMRLYGLASERILGFKPDVLTVLGLLKEKIILKIDPDPGLEEELDRILSGIRKKDFPGVLQDYCKVCEYAPACPTKKMQRD